MKRFKTIAVVLAMAVLCFAATAMASEFSFYDNVNDWIVRAYTVQNPTGGTYTVYLEMLNDDGTPVESADIVVTKNGDPVSPTASGYPICGGAASSEISLAYKFLGVETEVYAFDTHVIGEPASMHNNTKLSRNNPVPPANISVTPTSVSFGNIIVGSSSTNFITVSNTGEADLTLNSITVTGASFVRDGGTCVDTVSAGGSCTIGVEFEPEAVAPYTGNLQINSDDNDTPTVNVALSGTGFQQTGPVDLIVSMVTHLGTIGGGADLAITVTVKNQGTGASGPFVVRGTKGTSTEMYTWDVPSLAAGQTLVNTLNYTFECAAHSGFYLYHTADANQQVTESNESNNMRWSYVYCNR